MRTSIGITLRNELSELGKSCNPASRQLSDYDMLVEMEKIVETLSLTVETLGRIWTCGSGEGLCSAMSATQQLLVPTSTKEAATRATLLGVNPSVTSVEYCRDGLDAAVAKELEVNGRQGDALWCFTTDASLKSMVNVASVAHEVIKIPVVLFTTYPGTPIIKFGTHKLCVKRGEQDAGAYCVSWVHSLAAHLICRQLRRVAKKTRKEKR